MIKNIFFDFGRTIVEHPEDGAGLRILQKYGAETEEDARLVQSVIFSVPKYINFLDEGSLDRDEYKRLALAELPQRLHRVALKAADYPITELSVLPGMKELVQSLRARGFKLYITSNLDELHAKQMYSTEVATWFDGMIFSSEVKARKPSAEFFKAACDRFGADPAECLFIDDLEENVKGGEAFGIKGLVFTGDPKAVESFIDGNCDPYRDFTLLTDGKEAFPEILRCMEAAQKSIYINMFIWRDDAIGNRLARAVLDAANRGVRVTISKDRYGVVLEKCEEGKRSFFHKKQNLVETIKSRGLELLYPMANTPKVTKDEETELYRAVVNHPNIRIEVPFKADHSKYYIFDDEILIMGGINVEDKENGQDMQGRVYQDYMVKMNGRQYVQALRAKLQEGRDLEQNYFFGLNSKECEPHFFEMEQQYLKLIREAQKELSITMAYFTPLKEFTDAILDAVDRGVKVTLLVPEQANYQCASDRRTARYLLKASGGRIAVFFCPKMVHTKLVMNESWISFGSTNITKKAFHQLSELNLFVRNNDSAFCRALRDSLRQNRDLSERITDYKTIQYNHLAAFCEGLLM